MLLAAYLEMFHGSILLNCLLRGCNTPAIGTAISIINTNIKYK